MKKFSLVIFGKKGFGKKSLVYATPIEFEEDLVVRIAAASGEISGMADEFPNIRQSLRLRFEKCIDEGGTHFEQFL